MSWVRRTNPYFSDSRSLRSRWPLPRVLRYLNVFAIGMITGTGLPIGGLGKVDGARAVSKAEVRVPRVQSAMLLIAEPEVAGATPTNELDRAVNAVPHPQRERRTRAEAADALGDVARDQLEELARRGAREILMTALREEVDAYLGRRGARRDDE